VPKASLQGSSRAPLALILLDSSQFTLPSNMVPPARSPPPARPASLPSGHSGGVASSPSSDALSPLHARATRNFQDVLVFDPADGVLALRRMTIELRARDGATAAAAVLMPSVAHVGGTSVSLPGMGGAGRLSVSPPAPHIHTAASAASAATASAAAAAAAAVAGTAALTLTRRMTELTSEIAARESIEATWLLKRRGNWGEMRRAVEVGAGVEKPRANRTEYDDYFSFQHSS
jgi:hypothetical protein